MSMNEVKRYATDLNSDWGLRADAEKYEANANPNKTPLERAVSFAEGRGYDFTIKEAKAYALIKGQEIGVSVSEQDFDRSSFPHAGGVLGIITGDF